MKRYLAVFAAPALILLNSAALLGYFGVFDHDIPEEDPLAPRVYLARLCAERGCDFDLLDSIIWCESKWRMVKNATSSAYGYFQIIDSTERTTLQYAEGMRKFDPYHNLEMGVFLYERDGVNPWRESQGCWGWRYTGEEESCVGAECDV